MKTALSVAFALFIAGTAAASAADLAARPYTKAPAIAPVYNWTGFYVGLNAGIGGDKTDYNFGGLATGNLNSFGGFGGGQIGYNYQFAGNWVAGIEADIQGGSLKGEINASIPASIPPVSLSAGTETKWFGTVRGRLGYAFNNVLLYGTAGYAYGSEDTYLKVAPLATFSRSADLSGWTAGGGIEYGLSNNISLKTEYLYMEFDRNNVVTIGPIAIDNKVSAHTVKVGLNYAFAK